VKFSLTAIILFFLFVRFACGLSEVRGAGLLEFYGSLVVLA